MILAKEKVSFYTHFAGAVGALSGTILLLLSAPTVENKILGLVYGLSTTFLFSASSLYHAYKKIEDGMNFLRKMDHVAIFFMIAGTYTPICFIYLDGGMKWFIIIFQWSLVIFGLFFKLFYLKAPRILYTIIYLIMGWIALIPLAQLVHNMSATAIFYLILGGLFFTTGAIFYMLKRPVISPKYFGFHEIFHIFILLGWGAHFLMVRSAIC